MNRKGNIFLNVETGEIFILRQEIYANTQRIVLQSISRDTYFETTKTDNLILIGNIYDVVNSIMEAEEKYSR